MVLAALSSLTACAPRPVEHDERAPDPRDTRPAHVATREDAPPPAMDGARESVVRLADGIEVDRVRASVTIPARVAVTEGWIEQAACRAGTREHESLLVVAAPPSAVHAALLLAGFEPGHPGAVRLSGPGPDAVLERIPPAGDRLEVWVRGARGEVPLTAWMRDTAGRGPVAPHPWIFAGSRVRPNTRSMGPGEHYVADFTGSLVGVVTFGDETIAFEEARSGEAELDPPQWQARTEAMPASGTPVTIVVRRPPRDATPAP
jgi:hypothetical protein